MEYYLVLADFLPSTIKEWVVFIVFLIALYDYSKMSDDVKRLNKEFEILEKKTRVSFLGMQQADRLIYDQIEQKLENR